jgi:hypothetical protein
VVAFAPLVRTTSLVAAVLIEVALRMMKTAFPLP